MLYGLWVWPIGTAHKQSTFPSKALSDESLHYFVRIYKANEIRGRLLQVDTPDYVNEMSEYIIQPQR